MACERARLRFPEMHVAETAVHEKDGRPTANLIDVQFSHGGHYERR
jgi:hypothetical protein